MKSIFKFAIIALPLLLFGCTKEDTSSQTNAPMLYKLNEAIQNPNEVQLLQLTLDEFNGKSFDGADFPNSVFLTITTPGWNVWPPVEGDPNFPAVNWSKLLGMQALKQLDLSSIPVTTVPAELTSLPVLEELSLFLYMPVDINSDAVELDKVKSLRKLDLGFSVFSPEQPPVLIERLEGVEVIASTVIAPEFQDKKESE
ncbi:MAG: hypothetical protein AAGN35_02240 [Bacteroidota bacterium]